MRAKIEPWTGQKGTCCLMLVKHVPKPRGEYEKSKCKYCGQEVWITPIVKDLFEMAPDMDFSCTECAISRRCGKNEL